MFIPYWRCSGLRQFLAVSSCLISYFLIGVSLAWTSTALRILLDEEITPIPISTSQGSTIASIFIFGTISGSFIYSFFVDLLGRKWLTLVGIIINTIHWIVLYFSTEFYHLIIARIIMGLAISFVVSVLPTYVGEVTDTSTRSIFGIFIALQIPLGTIFMYAVGPYVEFYTLSLICLAIPFITLLFWLFMVESPYYLMRQNMEDEAKKSLMWLRAETDEEKVEDELKEIKTFVATSPKRPFIEIVRELGNIVNRKALLIVTLLVAGSQLNGVTAVRSYFHIIVEDIGTDLDVDVSVIILESIAFVVLLTSFFLINRVGRKILFLISVGGCIIGTFLCGLYFYLKTLDATNEQFSVMALVGLLCTQAFNAIGASSVPAIYASEMSTASLRSFFGTYFSLLAAGLGAVSMKIFEAIESNLGMQYSFWLFAICSTLICVALFFTMPETRGKTLQEIQDMLAGEKSENSTETS